MLSIKKYFLFLFVAVQSIYSQNNLSQYVNPFIGTGGHGHTFPGAVLPFGMVQLSPDTRIDGSWDGCSGYHYSDSTIFGFSHTHLSGTGCSDWGDVMLMPMNKEASLDNRVYASQFSHTSEKATVGFYEVFLEDEKTKDELTVTPRVGIHRYTFPASGEMNVVLDLLHRDKLLDGNIKIFDSVTLVGFRISEAWAQKQYCYFAIRFSQTIKKTDLAVTNKKTNGAIFHFTSNNKPLLVKVAISGVNEDGALANLKAEATHWDFEKYKTEAENIWNKQLQKIVVSSEDKNKLTVFYTALYHCFIHPSLNMDVESMYRGRDNEIHTSNGNTNYSVFSLWDTYRALHPLFTIIERERTRDFINTFLNQYKQSNRLPIWELSGNETDCMIGYHSVSVITDALVKGIGGLKEEELYNAMKASSNYTGFGIPQYCKKNFLDVEDESESVSRTLEYAYDDWCIAQIALRLGKKEDYNYFIKKAQSYKNLYDVKTGFMRPRKNGNWLTPFDAKEVNNYFTEGNSWQYSFYVPQDVEGLITLHGGREKFEAKLDSLFSTSSKTTGREQADITGLIGQYAHGNEPSHHMAYLYNYVGKPHKTQDLVSKIMNEFYTNSPDGLIGNEDCGQMSAWYVMSAMGFYPVCPGSTEYVIGKPLFHNIEINLEDGKKFLINEYSNSGESKYVQSIKLNGHVSYKSSINHSQILEGGSMTYSYEPKLSAENKFGKGSFQGAGNKIVVNQIVPTPIIKSRSKSFEGKQQIKIESNSSNISKIVYSNDGTEPNKMSKIYATPFFIDKSCTIKTKMYFENDSSSTNTANFIKKPNNWTVHIRNKYSKQYSAGGDRGIIDGIYGDVNWKKGEWQGYQYKDFECVVDMKVKKTITNVSLDFLQDTKSWIIFPTKVEIYISDDGMKFTLTDSVVVKFDPKDYNIQTKKIEKQLSTKQNARYIKLIAKNFGELPEWHAGAGDGAYLFVDEIEIK